MGQLSRDGRILIGALIALAVLSVISVLTAAPPPVTIPLSVRNQDEQGAMALRLWLERSGYEVRELLAWDELNRLDALFILQPIIDYSPAEMERLRDWVQRGNTLVVAGDPWRVNLLLEAFQVRLGSPTLAQVLVPAAPTLLLPPLLPVRINDFSPIETQRTDAIIHLAYQGEPGLISLNEGEGRLWVLSALEPLTNRGLRASGSAELVQNWLAGMPANARIGFDEQVHGLGETATPPGFNDWLFLTPGGWSVLALVSITFIYIAVRGRRFGRIEPLPSDRLQRESVEYVQAMGTLFRRTGQRRDILQHYEQQLRRRLSERYGLDPKLPADDLIRIATTYDATLSSDELRDVFTRLRPANVTEAQLIEAALAVDALLNKLRT